MVVLKTQSEFGHAPPPQTPYSIISNLPTWKVAEAFRDGDPGPLSRVVHLYPRFLPMQFAAQVRAAVSFVQVSSCRPSVLMDGCSSAKPS